MTSQIDGWAIVGIAFAVLTAIAVVLFLISLYVHRPAAKPKPVKDPAPTQLIGPPPVSPPTRYTHRPVPNPEPGPTVLEPAGRHREGVSGRHRIEDVDPARARRPADAAGIKRWDDTHVMRPVTES